MTVTDLPTRPGTASGVLSGDAPSDLAGVPGREGEPAAYDAPYAGPDEFRAALFEAGVLMPTSSDGLYHRSGAYEDVLAGLVGYLSRNRLDRERQRISFPPLIPRAEWLQTDYLRSFPDLMGSITVFQGTDRDHHQLLARHDAGEEWESMMTPAEVVVSSSTCHSLYGVLPKSIPATGLTYELMGYCFRHEPSLDPARMQSFRMMEFVTVGSAEQAAAHRDVWLDHAPRLLRHLGLPVRIEVANDPFFGRVGQLLAANQTEAALKHEMVVDITAARETAIFSVNLAEDHFGHSFGLTTPDGVTAHSACCGIGVERITLALFAFHGLDPAAWPADVRAELGLTA